MNTSAANSNIASKKRKAKTLPQPKNRNGFMAGQEEKNPGDDYIVPSEDESRLLTEEGTKNEKKNTAKRKYKNLRVKDSDSESDSETEDLVFDDFYPATRNLDKADKEELVNMNRLRQIVWTCPKRDYYEVEPLHCLKLVSNDCTVDRVVGSWMSILEDEFKDIPNVPTCYLGNIDFRPFVRRKSKIALKKELLLMKGKRLLCFPVCTPMSRNPDETPNHWTLIVLDVKEKKWTHFNTLTGTGKDWNYHHNQELMDWVDDNLGDEYVETERENYKDTQQQPNGSVDCGICLLMILEQLMLGKTKEQIKDMFKLRFKKNEVAKYRTRMVQTFLRLGKIQKEQKDLACGNIQHELKDVNFPTKYS